MKDAPQDEAPPPRQPPLAEDEDEDEVVSDAPLPPPPPPPPPPQLRPEEELQKCKQQQKKAKKKDFREILALFHDDTMDSARASRVWATLWQTTLAEAQEEDKRRRAREQQQQLDVKAGRKRPGDHDHLHMSARGGNGPVRHGSSGSDHLKRSRQGPTTSADMEPNKASRLGGRFQKGGPKGSKLLQKLGTRGN